MTLPDWLDEAVRRSVQSGSSSRVAPDPKPIAIPLTYDRIYRIAVCCCCGSGRMSRSSTRSTSKRLAAASAGLSITSQAVSYQPDFR